jgi:hypothetical protein
VSPLHPVNNQYEDGEKVNSTVEITGKGVVDFSINFSVAEF